MSLIKQFRRAVFMGLLAMTALTGCAKKIGAPDSDPALKGTTTEETLARSHTQIARIHLDGKNLQPDTKYKFNDVSLVIDGDVPEGTSISGDGGQLIVTGNVGNNARLEVDIPYYSHQESYQYTAYVMIGKIMVPQPRTGYRTIIDGPQPPYDKDPAIVVEGKLGNRTYLSPNEGSFWDVKP